MHTKKAAVCGRRSKARSLWNGTSDCIISRPGTTAQWYKLQIADRIYAQTSPRMYDGYQLLDGLLQYHDIVE